MCVCAFTGGFMQKGSRLRYRLRVLIEFAGLGMFFQRPRPGFSDGVFFRALEVVSRA